MKIFYGYNITTLQRYKFVMLQRYKTATLQRRNDYPLEIVRTIRVYDFAKNGTGFPDFRCNDENVKRRGTGTGRSIDFWKTRGELNWFKCRGTSTPIPDARGEQRSRYRFVSDVGQNDSVVGRVIQYMDVYHLGIV